MNNLNRSLRLSFFVVLAFALPAFGKGLTSPLRTTGAFSIEAVQEVALLRVGVQQHTKLDCTHWIHAIYERYGLSYPYTTSRTLYRGIREFRRVLLPQAGDLVVWQGHAGIILDPARSSFVSALRSGIKISSYVSHYWENRGSPRFFHYVASLQK